MLFKVVHFKYVVTELNDMEALPGGLSCSSFRAPEQLRTHGSQCTTYLTAKVPSFALGAITYSLTQKGDPFGVKPEDAVLRKIMVSARPL